MWAAIAVPNAKVTPAKIFFMCGTSLPPDSEINDNPKKPATITPHINRYLYISIGILVRSRNTATDMASATPIQNTTRCL